MAEDKFNSNAKSPRFSTNKAIGFKGGQQPSYQQVSGINRAAPPTSPEPPPTGDTVNPAISQFEAPRVPQQPGLVKTLAGGVASAAAGEGLKYGVKKAGNAIGSAVSNYFAPSGYLEGGGYASKTLQQSFPTGDNMSFAPGTTNAILENFGPKPDVPSWLSPDNLTESGQIDAAGGFEGANFFDTAGSSGADFAASYGADAVAGDFAGDLAGDTFGDAASFGDAAGGSVPIVGPALRLAQGDVGGAAGSAIGGYLGSTVFPGVGTAIGSALGGILGGDCFITEAVMSSGGADNGMELEALRGFRDNILSATPQGQAMTAEYEAIAPIVVEAVSQRPDGVQIFQQIKSEFIDPAVEAVQSGDFRSALQIYAQMISFVTPFAAESAEASMPGADTDIINQHGDHAAMVGYSPESAEAAIPEGGEWDPGVDDGMPPGQEYMPTGGQQGAMGMPQPPGGGMMQPGAPPAIGQTFAQRRY